MYETYEKSDCPSYSFSGCLLCQRIRDNEVGGANFYLGNMVEPLSVHTRLLESICNEQKSNYHQHQADCDLAQSGAIRVLFLLSQPHSHREGEAVVGKEGEKRDGKSQTIQPPLSTSGQSSQSCDLCLVLGWARETILESM